MVTIMSQRFSGKSVYIRKILNIIKLLLIKTNVKSETYSCGSRTCQKVEFQGICNEDSLLKRNTGFAIIFSCRPDITRLVRDKPASCVYF
jgi:hypothetical protein